MDLVRDVSDKLVLDRDGREIGRVDRVLVDIRADGLRIVAIEIGPAAFASRLSPTLGRWVAGLERALGFDEGRPMRVAIHEVMTIHPHVRVNRAFADTPAGTVEATLRRWLPRLPGAA
jgi:sporulation protein YlmC with PRC-barrel domain